MNEDYIDVTKLNEIHVNTYIKKADFIKMIENLNFVAIQNCNIDFITAFEYDGKDNKTIPRGFQIDIS